MHTLQEQLAKQYPKAVQDSEERATLRRRIAVLYREPGMSNLMRIEKLEAELHDLEQ